MADFPKIQSPCPLRVTMLPREGADFCGQCSRKVHNLSAMSPPQRREFMSGCGDSKVCVAYSMRVPRHGATALGLGVGLAAALVAAPALAGDPLAQDVQSALSEVVSQSAVEADIEFCPDSPPPEIGEYYDIAWVGGIERADAAVWVGGESLLAELPRADASVFLAQEDVAFGPAPDDVAFGPAPDDVAR